MIKLKNLTKKYDRAGVSFDAVSNVSLEIAEGDFVNIIGRSGSGKTTMLGMIVGLITPTEGEIRVEGNSYEGKTDAEISLIRNEIIGYIPQGIGTFPHLNVIDNVCLPHFLYSQDIKVYDRASDLLKELEIYDLKDSYPKQLSGGEQRRVLIARALINNPKIIIADEPTADLDVVTTKEVMTLLKQINEKGTTLVIVSHEPDTLKYGNRVVELERGEIISIK